MAHPHDQSDHPGVPGDAEVPATMRAFVTSRFGSPDHLVEATVPTPRPGPGDVLVRVRATSVTRGDAVLRKMPRLVTRLVGEQPKTVLGHEFSGDVVAVGPATSGLAVGDRVFGTTSGLPQGSHAEYVAVPADGVVATIPTGVGYEQAAPVPVGAMTALHFLRAAGTAEGSRVLVNGASGSVGSFAVQIARALGASVTAVTGSSNIALVDGLGADRVIDYTLTDVTAVDWTFDVVFDAVAKLPAKRARSILAEGGSFVTTRARRHETRDELLTVRSLLADGSIEAVVDRTYPFDQIPEAHRHVDTGHKRGNLVITLP